LNGIGAAGRRDWIVIMGGRQHACALDWRDDGADITVDDAGYRLQTAWRPGAKVMEGRFDGEAFSVKLFERSEGYVLRLRGVAQRAIVASPRGAALHERLPEKPKADTSKLVMSPMPGLVVSVDVVVGQDVKEGEGVAIVEAMKMQNIIRAERDGTVAKVNVAAGASVMADEVLVELA
jgi:propionyl-CoA carboxylase alpha chain